MRQVFSNSWIKSKQPRKQRKYRMNAPDHTRGKFVSAHLNSELRKKYGTRSIRLRTGDKVKVMRGSFKGHQGKVERINIKEEKIYIERIEITKREGAKAHPPLRPSNLMIVELYVDDKRRIAKLTGTTPKKAEEKSVEKVESKPVEKKVEEKTEVKKEEHKSENKIQEAKPKVQETKKEEKK